jgi:hypothetical protein
VGPGCVDDFKLGAALLALSTAAMPPVRLATHLLSRSFRGSVYERVVTLPGYMASSIFVRHAPPADVSAARQIPAPRVMTPRHVQFMLCMSCYKYELMKARTPPAS